MQIGATFAVNTKNLPQEIEAILNNYNITLSDIKTYINPWERLIGVGRGGSESLVLFLQSPKHNNILARKILSEKVLAFNWDPRKNGAMTSPIKKAYLQVEYLRNLPDEVKPYFPEIYDFKIIKNLTESNDKDKERFFLEAVNDQSYIPGLELSTFIERYKPAPVVVAHLYKEVLRCLKEKIHLYRRQVRKTKTVEVSYFYKIKDRLKITRIAIPKVFTPLVTSKYIWVNGIKYINAPFLLSKFKRSKFLDFLEPKYLSLVAGDTNTENIKIANINLLLNAMQNNNLDFTYEDLGIKFLDPRAIGFESCGRNTIDDYMYDSKLFHNSIGNYDIIHREYFSLIFNIENNEPNIRIEQSKNHPFRKSYFGFESYFKYIMEEGWNVNSEEFLSNDPYWLIRFVFIMGTHFIAMPPFHLHKDVDEYVKDEYSAQKRAVAVYCEGLKWLNTAYQMLIGRVKEFYGVPVPRIPKIG